MKCIVVGGSGFVGRWLVKELIDRGDEVANFDVWQPKESWKGETFVYKDKGDPAQILDSTIIHDVDEVYDMGAIVGTGGFNAADALRSLKINTVGTLGVLWAADQAGVKRYYYPAMPDDNANIYTVTKKAGEMLCKIFESKSGMEVKMLRWGNIYGPGQALVPRRLVPYAIMNLLAGKPVQIFGKGLQKVEMINVKDVARITVDFVRNGSSDGIVYDVNCESFLSVKDVIVLMKRLTESLSAIESIPMRDGEDEIVDEEPVGSDWLWPKMPELFDNMIPLASGLTETIEWYKEHPWLLKEGIEYYESL